MAEDRLAPDEVINLAGALWSILCREYPSAFRDFQDGLMPHEAQYGFVTSLVSMPNLKMQRGALKGLHSQLPHDEMVRNSQMTVAGFVENKFVPEHVTLKRSSERTHYDSMLKHILKPEEVDRILTVKGDKSRQKLKPVPGWPYLSEVRLCDMRPSHVSRLVSAAIAKGYSLTTVMHLRSVVGAIFSYAKQEGYFTGENPALLVCPPEIRRKRTSILTLAQAEEALLRMGRPEKELTLLAVYSGLNLAEILGLQWKHVNLSQAEISREGERIPPMTIAVRDLLFRGRLESVKKSRLRNVPIPAPLLHVLQKVGERERFIGPNDFVFVSQVGTPINQHNLLARRLRPIARQLGVPSLSCQAFRGVRKILASKSGKRFEVFTYVLCGFSSSKSAR